MAEVVAVGSEGHHTYKKTHIKKKRNTSRVYSLIVGCILWGYPGINIYSGGYPGINIYSGGTRVPTYTLGVPGYHQILWGTRVPIYTLGVPRYQYILWGYPGTNKYSGGWYPGTQHIVLGYPAINI